MDNNRQIQTASNLQLGGEGDLLNRLIFVTGDMLSGGSRRFLDDAGRPYLEKPLNPNDVRRTVARVCEAVLGNG